ncbi:hypothetical protein WN944_027951 [Citrus x changshan-huyou]|uniref:Uncharacterized protein n=1 Tax=Citrus x changshan-huyou TaxID=2935761 RepID=A0AAP0Q8Z1_9ROSI
MEHEAFNLTKKQNHRLPPKRGQVLKEILKYLFGSAGGKKKGDGLVSRDSKNLHGTRTRGGLAHSGRLLVVGLVAQAHQPQLKLLVATIQMLPLSLISQITYHQTPLELKLKYTHFKKMEYEAYKLTKNQNLRLPPKRGQVLKKILKDLLGSAGGKRRRNGLGGGGGLSSSSSTPAETPSGYSSDAASES